MTSCMHLLLVFFVRSFKATCVETVLNDEGFQISSMEAKVAVEMARVNLHNHFLIGCLQEGSLREEVERIP